MPIKQELSVFAVPDAVLACCQEKGIRAVLEQALAIVRDAYPDLVEAEIGFEDHEVLDRGIRIGGRVPGSPDAVAQRVWDCVGRWAAVLPPEALMYFQLGIHAEGQKKDDSLMDELLASNPRFQELVARSKRSPRKPFLAGEQGVSNG